MSGASARQKELEELRQRGTASKRRADLKDLDVGSPLTTPEEAQAFLASMRDKQKQHGITQPKPPTHLNADGMTDWFTQQRQREKELKQRRKEAEALLRGYRSSLDERAGVVPPNKAKVVPVSPTVKYAQLAASKHPTYQEAMGDPTLYEADLPEEPEEEEGDDDEYVAEKDDEPPQEQRPVGKLNIQDEPPSDGFEIDFKVAKGEEKQEAPIQDKSIPLTVNTMKLVEDPNDSKEDDGTGQIKAGTIPPSKQDTPKKSRKHKKRSKTEKPYRADIGTPARQGLPDEVEWRKFVQPDSHAEFPAESGRYHLYASYACPGSHRALIVRALKGLQSHISVTIVHPTWRLTRKGTPEEQRGWVFGNPDAPKFHNTAGRGGPFPAAYPGNDPDPVMNAYSVRDIYEKAGDKAGKYTVPFLWDLKKGTIVNNESSDIAYMLNSSFNEFSEKPELDLYTEDDPDPQKLTDVIEWLSPLMIHGVYRCGFAKSQAAYNKAIKELTAAFDRADDVLQQQRYLTGDTLTDADIRLFVTLLRFDEVYAFYFRANTRLVMLTPALLNFCREIYQMDGVADTCNMEQIKAHFYSSHAEWNKFSIIPKGLGFMKQLKKPHNRDEMPEFDGSAALGDEKKEG